MSGLRERMNRLRGLAAAAREAGADDTDADRNAATAPDGTGMRAADISEAGRNEAGGGPGRPGTGAAAVADAVPPASDAAGDADGSDAEDEPLHPAWTELGVKLVTNEWGGFLLRETRYPQTHYHGTHRLGEWETSVRGLAAFHPGVSDEGIGAEEVLFLDLETTGLGAGAGNVPFMIGLGYWDNGSYVVEQSLIRHPAEERAMLARLIGLLPRFRFLATYNGRTFDWPVLESRFILNGFGRTVWTPLHLDFLHPSRSVWRNTLASCRLSHVEEERLGIVRRDDVPGSLAPSIYFQFLADGDPRPLAGVFHHNETDMLSLASLAIRFGHLLSGGLGTAVPFPDEPEEMVRTGLWLERMGHAAAAAALFERASGNEDIGYSTLIALAARDKKAGNWRRAVLLWQRAALAAASGATYSCEAHIELAMFYEHKMKDYESALAYAEGAFELIQRHPLLHRGGRQRAELEALRKRRDRLRRKLQAAKPTAQ